MTQATQRGARLYVAGVDYGAQKEELAELFSKRGIASLRVDIPFGPGLGRLGFAFVTVAADDAERAICALNGQIFRGRTLKIERARPKSRGIKARKSNRNFGSEHHRRLSQ